MFQSIEQTTVAEVARVSRARALVLGVTLVAGLGSLLALGPFRGGAEVPANGGATPEGERLALVAGPISGPEVLSEELWPIVRYLERELGVTIELSPPRSSSEVMESLAGGDGQIAILPSLAWVQAREQQRGVRLLAIQSRDGACTCDTVLVGRRGEALRHPSQIRGRRICTAEAQSASGDLLARSWARSLGERPDELWGEVRRSGDPLSALRDLLAGRCDLAAVEETTIREAEVQGLEASAFEVMVTTGRVPNPAWIGSHRLDEGLARAISSALTAFDPDEEIGLPWVGRTLRIDGFRGGDGSSYRAVWVAAQLEGVLRPGS